MNTCRELGITVRRYFGWEPRTFTTTINGQTVTRPEPEWDVWERQLWKALAEYEAGLCPNCRQPLAECLIDTNIPESERPVYAAGFLECAACRVLEQTQIRVDRLDAEWAKDHEAEAKTNPPTRMHRVWHVTKVAGRALAAPLRATPVHRT